MGERSEVVEMMVRYGAGIDRKDWALLRSCFTPDVRAEYVGFGLYDGYDALEGFLRSSVERLDATQHTLTNFLVQLADDRAQFQCSVIATHVRHSAPGGHVFTVGGPYDNHAVRTGEGWRMNRFSFRSTWTSGNPDVLQHVHMDERVPL